jgi:hypothetical protein
MLYQLSYARVGVNLPDRGPISTPAAAGGAYIGIE